MPVLGIPAAFVHALKRMHITYGMNMLDPSSTTPSPRLGPLLLGAVGAFVVLLVLLYGLVWRPDTPSAATVSTMLALPLVAAFLWSGVVKYLIPEAPLGVPAAGYAAVWALLGLGTLLPTLDVRYVTFLFVSFICLFLGRLGERAVRWLFPERFGS